MKFAALLFIVDRSPRLKSQLDPQNFTICAILPESKYSGKENMTQGTSFNVKEKIRPIAEKKRFRCLETLERSTADIPVGLKVISVCDREGDMYEFSLKRGI